MPPFSFVLILTGELIIYRNSDGSIQTAEDCGDEAQFGCMNIASDKVSLRILLNGVRTVVV